MPSPYGRAYRKARATIIAQALPCRLRLVCDGVVADSVDHDPPLAQHHHIPGSGCCRLVPACLECQHVQGGMVRVGRWQQQPSRVVPGASRAW